MIMSGSVKKMNNEVNMRKLHEIGLDSMKANQKHA